MRERTRVLRKTHPKLVLLRHGLSVANEGNAFGGWDDVELSEVGISQARAAGLTIKQAGMRFDRAYTSALRRAAGTLAHCQLAIGIDHLPTECDWRLNERHFGELQGMTKAAAEARYGARQLGQWRNEFDARPPSLAPGDLRDSFGKSPYQNLPRDQIPLAESLRDTHARVLGFWRDSLMPALREGMNVLIVAHGNSIRAMLMEIEGIPPSKIAGTEVTNALPLIYQFDAALERFSRCADGRLPGEDRLHEVFPACS